MTNDELREKLWEVEKELAEYKRVVEGLIRERMESQMVLSSIMPFLPEIREKGEKHDASAVQRATRTDRKTNQRITARLKAPH